MPVVHCIDQRKGKRQLVDLIFPKRTSDDAKSMDRWEWPELRAAVSGIQGRVSWGDRSCQCFQAFRRLTPMALRNRSGPPAASR